MKGSRWRSAGLPTDGRKDKDEDLLLFHEMRRREKEHIVSLLQPDSEEFEPNPGNYPLYRISSKKKRGGHDLLSIEGEKNDYDWLKTPPATPLFPSLEMEAIGPNSSVQKQIPILQPLQYSRFSGNSLEPKPKQESSNQFSGNPQANKANYETKTLKPKAADSARPIIPIRKSNVSATKSSTNKRISVSNEGTKQSISDSNGKQNPTAIASKITNAKESSTNSTNPNQTKSTGTRVSDPKLKSRGASPLVRSRSPATLPGFFDETPTNLITSSDRSISATRRRPSTLTSVTNTKPDWQNPRSDRAISATKGRPANSLWATDTKSDRATSATRGRPANSTPVTDPKSDRVTSATRGRSGNSTLTTNTKPEAINRRRQSCSPNTNRGRKPEFRQVTTKAKAGSGNGSLISGSRMVEKVMNARQSGRGEEKEHKMKNRVSANESFGFGRMMSKSSLDMALKHMEIKSNYSSSLLHNKKFQNNEQ